MTNEVVNLISNIKGFAVISFSGANQLSNLITNSNSAGFVLVVNTGASDITLKINGAGGRENQVTVYPGTYSSSEFGAGDHVFIDSGGSWQAGNKAAFFISF